jgi:uncharacterized protein (TIRG00374 family)
VTDLPATPLAEPSPARRWFWDWRVWLGVAITVGCLWYTMRGIPLGDVRQAMASADVLMLIVLSVPSYVLSVYVRALRWRHLTNPIASIPRMTLFRAEAIGFMVNNIVPLRIGELVRTWYLARESRTSVSAILGTVVLERVLDVVCLLLMALGALALMGGESDDSGMLSRGAMWLLPAAALPLGGLILLRVAPERMIAIAGFVTKPLPEHIGVLVTSLLERFIEGLGALSGGSHLFWILLHSLTIWLVFSTVPFLAAVYAFDLDLGTPIQVLTTTWVLLAAVGVAVALPAAPGFFGTYQMAFSIVLTRFGVPPATALAIGLLAWFVFWVTLTLQGLLLLRVGGLSLEELTQASGKDPS